MRKDYLQISVFLDPVVMKQEGVPHALLKVIGGVMSKVVRRQLTKRGQARILRCQYQLLSSISYMVKARLFV